MSCVRCRRADGTDINPHGLTGKVLVLQLGGHKLDHVVAASQESGPSDIVGFGLALVEALQGLLLVTIAVTRVRLEEAAVDEAQVGLQRPGHDQLRLDETNDEEGGKEKQHDDSDRRNTMVGDFRERHKDAPEREGEKGEWKQIVFGSVVYNASLPVDQLEQVG